MHTKSDILSQFGTIIRELREQNGYSQESLAHKCGLDRTYISGIERGKRNISLWNIKILANALDVSISQLFEKME